MVGTRHTHAAFHATGRRLGEELAPVAGLDLRPILVARYRDLTTIRYDFPLVLVPDDGDGFVKSLSGIMDDLIGALAETDATARMASDVLKIEMEIRALVAHGHRGSLATLWDAAADRLRAQADDGWRDSLKRARTALRIDGDVIDCDGELPRRFFEHAWRLAHDRKAASFRARASRLTDRLRELLRGDFSRSHAGRAIDHLEASFAGQHDAFDFDAMARVLASTAPGSAMPESRRRRIEKLIAAIDSQRLYPAPGESGEGFVFDSCATAQAAYRERLPALVELAKSLTIAELEVAGVYDEGRHDAFFAQSDADTSVFDADDLASFPDYFVLVDAVDMDQTEPAAIIDVLSSGLPMKVLFQADLRSAPLARMTIGLANAFVLQAPGSHLFQMRRQVAAGFAFEGPALFSVHSGVVPDVNVLPPYLVAAAALESRAFPAFAYDPAASDGPARVDLSMNPQPDRDWPVHRVDYEDRQHQRVSVDLAFTFVDFAACDRRYARHLALVPHRGLTEGMLPVSDWLATEAVRQPLAVPSLLMVDRDGRLQRVLADDTILRDARQCRDRWRSLQEFGRIHDTQISRSVETAPAPAVADAAPTPPGADRSIPAVPEAAASSDEPFIETPRCSTCNECIQINNRMFAYNGNRQAYIADARAGTYQQLVEAAESCQVSIIHPGKPLNPSEPGLDELIARAQPFR